MTAGIKETPWDKKVFGIDTYEIVNPTEDVLQKAMQMNGHFTVKIDPLADKEPLHRHGFYYCDTLIEPFCTKDRFQYYAHEKVSLTKRADDFQEMKYISDGAFVFGRYHRDFNLEPRDADRRYANWLYQMYEKDNVYSLYYDGELAGFFGYDGANILLYTHKPKFKGKGVAKYFWSVACRERFDEGYDELVTSISAANVAMLNLQASLGFKFREARDVYHKLNRV